MEQGEPECLCSGMDFSSTSMASPQLKTWCSACWTVIGIICNTAQTCFINNFLCFLDRLHKVFLVWDLGKQWHEILKSGNSPAGHLCFPAITSGLLPGNCFWVGKGKHYSKEAKLFKEMQINILFFYPGDLLPFVIYFRLLNPWSILSLERFSSFSFFLTSCCTFPLCIYVYTLLPKEAVL